MAKKALITATTGQDGSTWLSFCSVRATKSTDHTSVQGLGVQSQGWLCDEVSRTKERKNCE